jgi:hypothetical protein
MKREIGVFFGRSRVKCDRKKPGVAFWATVGLVVVLVGYPLSFGPACWIVSRQRVSQWLPDVYWPIGWCAVHSTLLMDSVCWYARLGMREHSKVYIPNKGGWGFRINN